MKWFYDRLFRWMQLKPVWFTKKHHGQTWEDFGILVRERYILAYYKGKVSWWNADCHGWREAGEWGEMGKIFLGDTIHRNIPK